MSHDSPVHHVLWTGGWDSTYRVADLVLTYGRAVQPVYVVDPERRSTRIEVSRMEAIAAALASKEPAAATLLRRVELVDLADVPDDPIVDAASASVGARTPMGSQYSWLARLARARAGDGLELGWEGVPRFGPILDVTFARNDRPAPDDWVFMPREGNDPDRWTLFGAYRLPVLYVEKVQMRDEAVRRGFDDVMALTWFCRWPTVLRRPCGYCDPCQSTRALGLTDRVPRPTALRGLAHRSRWGLMRRGAVLSANWGSVTSRVRSKRSR